MIKNVDKNFDPVFNCAKAKTCAHIDGYHLGPRSGPYCPCGELEYVATPKMTLVERIVIGIIVATIVVSVTGLVNFFWH